MQEAYDTYRPVSRHTDDVTPSERLDERATGEHLPPPGRPAAARPGNARGKAKPAVRRIARDLGVDLDQIDGTGPDGLITAEDVVAAASGGSQRPAGDRRLPLRGIAGDVPLDDSLAGRPAGDAMIQGGRHRHRPTARHAQAAPRVRRPARLSTARVRQGVPAWPSRESPRSTRAMTPKPTRSSCTARSTWVSQRPLRAGCWCRTSRTAERMNLTELAQALNAHGRRRP